MRKARVAQVPPRWLPILKQASREGQGCGCRPGTGVRMWRGNPWHDNSTDPPRPRPLAATCPQIAEPERVITFRVSWLDDAGNLQVRAVLSAAQAAGRQGSGGWPASGLGSVEGLLPVHAPPQAGCSLRPTRLSVLLPSPHPPVPCSTSPPGCATSPHPPVPPCLPAVQVNRGFRVQYSSAIGPYKGGLRFHPSGAPLACSALPWGGRRGSSSPACGMPTAWAP